MTTVLDLEPLITAFCLAAVAVVWAWLFWRTWQSHKRRNAGEQARAHYAEMIGRTPPGNVPVQRFEALEAEFNERSNRNAS